MCSCWSIRSYAVIVLVFLSGCASIGNGRDVDDPTNSLVFAYIDMDDAPTDIDHAKLQQVAPKADAGYWTMGTDDGLILNQYIPPGSHQVSTFGGSSFLAGEFRYSFAQFGRNSTAVTIEQPGIYFLGSYRYEEVDTGFFEADKFAIEPVSTPSEQTLLKKISQFDWVKGTQWESRIRDRLMELNK